jgi:hypothetical protein
MTYYIKTGKTTRLANSEDVVIHTELPPGNYTLCKDMHGVLYMEEIDAFPLPKKVYGNITAHANRIMNTFLDREPSTGVMLSGEKGSGKSLLAKLISNNARELGISTLVVTEPLVGSAFNMFIQEITQPTIVLFDEFEKVYNRSQQLELLSLFDGVFPSKKLFLLTCNDRWGVDLHMRNRPGRIYYSLEFKGVEETFIREYCEDNLLNLSLVDDICKISALFAEFNMDMLRAMVEELNRYDETPQTVMQLLNTKPEYSSESTFVVELHKSGKPIDQRWIERATWSGNPLSDGLSFDYREYDEKGEWEWDTLKFDVDGLVSVNPTTKQYVFENKQGDRVYLTKAPPRLINYAAF